MARWEIKFYVHTDMIDKQSYGIGTPAHSAASLWNNKHKDGESSFDVLQECANNGWELVSVTPIVCILASNGSFPTGELLFSFKRQIDE